MPRLKDALQDLVNLIDDLDDEDLRSPAFNKMEQENERLLRRNAALENAIIGNDKRIAELEAELKGLQDAILNDGEYNADELRERFGLCPPTK